MVKHESNSQFQEQEIPFEAKQQQPLDSTFNQASCQSHFNCNAPQRHQLPTNAQSGLQYTALASITSTDSDPSEILRQFKRSLPATNIHNFTKQPLPYFPSAGIDQSSEKLNRPFRQSQKRNIQDSYSDDLEPLERASKKVYSGDMPADKIELRNLVETLEVNLQVSPYNTTQPFISSTTPTSVESAPPALIVPRTAQSEQDIDFDDLVNQLLERVMPDIDTPQFCTIHLSTSELKQLTRRIEVILKRGLSDELRADTMASLLKYLEISISYFASIDPASIDNDPSSEGEHDDIGRVSRSLSRISLSLEHVMLSLIIFDVNHLQHLFPEELLIDALSVFKSYLDKFLTPALEFSKDFTGLPMYSQLFSTIAKDDSVKKRMLTVVGTTCEISEKLRGTCRLELSDQIVVKLVYISLSLFFIDTSSELILGFTESESIRQAGSNLLQMIYAKQPNQRSWILEEILSLLIKLPHGKKVSKGYRLIDGTKIHSSSALLMQLLHTGSESPLHTILPPDFLEINQSLQKLEIQKLLDTIRVVQDEAKSSIVYILNFLLSRCAKGAKSSVDADYKMVLESLLSDFLIVLGQPEWPCAELYLLLISKAMIRYLDDPKADSASKSMAVDTLGSISARVKTILNHLAKSAIRDSATNHGENRPFYGAICSKTKLPDLLFLQISYNNVIEYLGFNEVNDFAANATKKMWICQWTHTICNAIMKDTSEDSWDKDCWTVMVQEISKYWRLYDCPEMRLRPNSVLTRSQASQSSMALTAHQQLFLSFDTLLSRILATLEGGAVTLRAKSLKALSLIVTGDYAVLAQQNVRNTIALRLQDQSPSVRDAATDLVGKYMLQDAVIRKAYYDIVSERISDTGLNVRKRVIRLLRDIYHKFDSPVMRQNIFQKLLLRVYDEEATVKELAIKSVSEVCFSPFIQATNLSMEDDEAQDMTLTLISITSAQKREISRHARTLVDMIGKLSSQQDEAVGSVISHLLRRERIHNTFDLAAQGQELTRSCSILVDSLVDLMQTLQDEDAPKSAVAATVHTLYIFVKSEPRLLEAKHLSALSVYLHCSSTSEDWRITMFVLRIFQDTVPVIHGMSLSDSQMIEKLVLALVAKCPVVLLPEATSVLCLVVNVMTVQYDRLCKFFQTCVDLLNVDAGKLRRGIVVQENKTRRLMTIVSLLCRHFSFDQAAKDMPEQNPLAELKIKMLPTVQEYIYEILATLCGPDQTRSLQQTALQSIGHIYMSFPILMNTQKSLDIMDSVFASHDNELKSELLQIYNNFLTKIQATPVTEQSKYVNYSLMAKAEDHLEAGIGSAVMQRYLDRILQCVLVTDKRLQAAAMEVIIQVTQQALVHPMLCMPAIVALETSDDPLPDADIQGFKISSDTGDMVSLLAPMYSLVGDKRQARNSLLSALVKVLDVDIEALDVEVDGKYSRFIAEMLAYLEYRTTEEVFLIIFLLNRIIAGSGISILQRITDMSLAQQNSSTDQVPKKNVARRKGIVVKNVERKKTVKIVDDYSNKRVTDTMQDDNDLTSMKNLSNAKDGSGSLKQLGSIAKVCTVLEVVMELKSHLKRVYDISEMKCQQFQPTAHASHKEKPAPRFTGALARIQWKSSAHELEAICGKPDVLQDDVVTQRLIQEQLERFQQLIETETVEQLSEVNHMNSRPSPLQESILYRGHANEASLVSDESEEENDDDH
ncbi:Sister chromatid cohesion protein 2 [Haplosporangium sp. Z 27]|nr:Sister chromatid cohesion protein 2 [Haplosporangium sp. Z 27]